MKICFAAGVGAAASIVVLLALRSLDREPFQAVEPGTIRGEWTQWRGGARDGSVSGTAKPGEWPERAVTLWEREVGGGYSGPIVAGDRVWIHSRQGGAEVVQSLTLDRGDTAWSQRYDAPFQQDSNARDHGRGPYATPALAGGRLFTFGVTSVVSAWDADTGRLLWRHDYAREFDPGYPIFGVALSPLVWEGSCFVHVGYMGWESRGRGKGAMVALDVADGRERWRWDEDGPSAGASPILALIGGRRHLVFKSQENIVGLDPSNGRELWRVPYKAVQDNTIVTPLFSGDVLVTSDSDMGLRAWRIESREGGWIARRLWETRAASMFTSSPVLVAVGGISQVVGFSHFKRGQLFGQDPVTGEVVWRGPVRSGEHASLVAWGSDLLAFHQNGSLVVWRVERDGIRRVRQYALGRSGTWAHPAVAGNHIVVRDGERLAAFRFDGVARGG